MVVDIACRLGNRAKVAFLKLFYDSSISTDSPTGGLVINSVVAAVEEVVDLASRGIATGHTLYVSVRTKVTFFSTS